MSQLSQQDKDPSFLSLSVQFLVLNGLGDAHPHCRGPSALCSPPVHARLFQNHPHGHTWK